MSTTLKIGSRGAAVRDLQTMLNRAVALPTLLDIDGIFGRKTDEAVRSIQERLELVIDGKYGPQTRAALKQFLAPVQPGRAEPDKSAMQQTVERIHVPGNDNVAAAPPNVSSLRLLDTSRFIDTIFVHCAATPEGKDFTVADIRAWHKARGFTDVGYHYVIYRDGRIMLGRPIGQVGAHVADHNTGSIGISYIGGVAADGKTAKDTRTPAQRASMLWLVGALKAKHPRINKVRGHNEVAAKACPSFIVREDALAAA
jgi:N-acetylmuramoyl-L-alanine amidase